MEEASGTMTWQGLPFMRRNSEPFDRLNRCWVVAPRAAGTIESASKPWQTLYCGGRASAPRFARPYELHRMRHPASAADVAVTPLMPEG